MLMNNFTFYSPTYFVFGKGEESIAGEMVKRFKHRNSPELQGCFLMYPSPEQKFVMMFIFIHDRINYVFLCVNKK